MNASCASDIALGSDGAASFRQARLTQRPPRLLAWQPGAFAQHSTGENQVGTGELLLRDAKIQKRDGPANAGVVPSKMC